MKELEREFRKSMLWRVWGFWGFVAAFCITFSIAIHDLYAATGDEELEITKQQIKRDSKSWLEEKKELQKLKTSLAKELEECKNNNSPDKLLTDCEGQIKIVDVDIQDFDRKLQHCKGDLRSAQMNN